MHANTVEDAGHVVKTNDKQKNNQLLHAVNIKANGCLCEAVPGCP